jgi:hypothetical protein
LNFKKYITKLTSQSTKPALPELTTWVNNKSLPERVRKLAAKTAKKIDPAAAAAAGIE